MKKHAIPFLKHFGLKHLSDLIGKKFLINLKHKFFDGEDCESEICFEIRQYFFQAQNLCILVPTIGLEGNNDVKDILLTFYPARSRKKVKHAIYFKSDYLKDDEKPRNIYYKGRDFKIALL